MSNTILVVDDEDSLRLSMQKRLASAGFSVETASDGEEALEVMKKHPFDVVLLDVNMPRMDGKEALPLIQHSYPNSDVIMMTGFADFSSAVECLKAGAKDYLVKPIESTELASRIGSLLRARKSERALLNTEQQYFSLLMYDFFGPLRTVSEIVRIALEPPGAKENEDRKTLLAYAKDLTNEMSEKLQQVIDPAKIDDTLLTVECQDENVAELTSRVCAQQELLGRAKNISVRTVMDLPVPSVWCDAERIAQVLQRLLDVLIGASTAGGNITVSVSPTSKQEEGTAKNYVLVSINADGSQIQEEDINVLFRSSPHWQGGSGRDIFGTGVSVGIAKRIVDAHRGVFWVDQKSDNGITFSFMLPTAPPA